MSGENWKTPFQWFSLHSVRFSRIGLKGKLMIALIPAVVLILISAAYLNYHVAERFINIAIDRNVRMRNLAMTHEIERALERARGDLLFFSQGDLSRNAMAALLKRTVASGGPAYMEFAFLPVVGNDSTYLAQHSGTVAIPSREKFPSVSPDPMLDLDRLKNLKPGMVDISPVMEVEFPFPAKGNENQRLKEHVIRFFTQVPASDTHPAGLLMLSLDARHLRNILSLYNSDQSPLWAFPRSDELRFNFMVDAEGWILFQSERTDKPESPLTTYLARTGYEGALGKPGHKSAFRPTSAYSHYWEMVEAIRRGGQGLNRVQDKTNTDSAVKEYFFSYAPVCYSPGGDAPSRVYAGVVYVDRSQLPIVAGYEYMDATLLFTLLTIALIALLIYWLGLILFRPIRELTARMNEFDSPDKLEEIRLPYSGLDIDMLTSSINGIIRKVKSQLEEIRQKDRTIQSVNLRERASLARERQVLAEAQDGDMPEIVGTGPIISRLKSDILKASQVDVDVLITGETGTGKQLVAEAIHNNSVRAGSPFVVINCGALDENLLLDALFGHKKGAFTEARTDRNGAFSEANGGTLFLDEIQSASPKVQQSLLRVLATRKIKPLGSDAEISVDVRIIAATNMDLSEMIERETFREDLYYRLKVVSIETPSLRNHIENVPLIAVHNLMQAEHLTGRNRLGLSKGALSKLSNYHWPGNVRELVNVITRAAVMAETETIQAEEIRLEEDLHVIPDPDAAMLTTAPAPETEAPDAPKAVEPPPPAPDFPSFHEEMNPRQKSAWSELIAKPSFSRKDYQEAVGGGLPSRTAIYDIQNLMEKGMLTKSGKGPATRYSVRDDFRSPVPEN
ncbi:sigma 54-interacting transcriptional regulator [Pseudodesulfovibrio tunisiensis]|uniref:sigma 54-interacting transcriptional regulator n=1 Tax=Pseudodesulfovibrio tunisiensis TaxID=463192 RepID=UPI001FB4F2FB|nr:sigma-54 dependent transcriptional regulator [Pseudodesulfovibrio tunisiensis]